MNKVAEKTPVVELRLRDVMVSKGMSVDRLSIASGISRQTIYNMLDRPVGIQLATLAKLCKALGVEPNTLLEYQEVKR